MAVSSLRGRVLEADLTWTGHRFERGIRIRCDAEGRVAEIGTHLPHDSVTLYLRNQILLPGMINAHSHAFHRGLRNFSENSRYLSDDKNKDNNSANKENFWTWRSNMYRLVSEYSKEQFYKICKQSFEEMLRTGITTVGEFHYWHHSEPRTTPVRKEHQLYDMDKVILKAAHDAGIRIVLLETFYEQAGLKKDQSLEQAQTHFLTQGLEEFWSNFENLQNVLEPSTQTLGIAAHSIRAVSRKNIEELYKEAYLRKLPFHIHLEEQMQEIRDSENFLGADPSAVLLKDLEIGDNFTGVHCTHSSPENLKKLLDNGANICICPLTEGRLGDGIFTWPKMAAEKLYQISLGTDCNNRICFAEEMRWLLYLQQVRSEQRGFPELHPASCGKVLFDFATVGGARSLGLTETCGNFEPGKWLDFFTVNLKNPILEGVQEDGLLDAFIFGGASDALVSSVGVGGNWRQFGCSLEDFRVKEGGISAESKKIDGSSVLALTQSLISIESVSGNEGPLADVFGDWLEHRGWSVLRQPLKNMPHRVNLMAMLNKRGSPSFKNARLILNSHLDTVPPHFPPCFDRSSGILSGRGACDAKGMIACMTFAAENFLVAHPELAADVALLFVVGEEVDHIGAKETTKLGLSPEFVICGEPTELKLARGQKGILKIHLVSEGKAAHSGYPEMGISALDPLLDVLGDLRKVSWPTNELGQTTMNIGVLKAGAAANIIPGQAIAEVAFRLVTPPDEIEVILKDTVRNRVKIEKPSGNGNGPLKLHVVEGFETQVVAFNTDLPYLNLPDGCKAYLFGPGSILNAHGPNDHVRLEELELGVQMYVQLMEKLLCV